MGVPSEGFEAPPDGSEELHAVRRAAARIGSAEFFMPRAWYPNSRRRDIRVERGEDADRRGEA
jgi:hypothetical protein